MDYKRELQPGLLWAKLVAYYQAHATDQRALGPHDLHVHFYLRDRAGAYYLYGPKLYYQDDPNGEHWQNSDQSAMANDADTLGEVTMINRRTRETFLVGKTIDEAINAINA